MAEWGRMILKKCRAGTTWESQSNKTTSVISAKERQCIGDSETQVAWRKGAHREAVNTAGTRCAMMKYCKDQMCNDEVSAIWVSD